MIDWNPVILAIIALISAIFATLAPVFVKAFFDALIRLNPTAANALIEHNQLIAEGIVLVVQQTYGALTNSAKFQLRSSGQMNSLDSQCLTRSKTCSMEPWASCTLSGRWLERTCPTARGCHDDYRHPLSPTNPFHKKPSSRSLNLNMPRGRERPLTLSKGGFPVDESKYSCVCSTQAVIAYARQYPFEHCGDYEIAANALHCRKLPSSRMLMSFI